MSATKPPKNEPNQPVFPVSSVLPGTISVEDRLSFALVQEQAASAQVRAELAVAKLTNEKLRLKIAYGLGDRDQFDIGTGTITRFVPSSS